MTTFPGRNVVLLSSLLFSHPAVCQVEESADARLRATCQAETHRASIPDSLRSALGALKFCGISGPPSVASAWTGFVADDTTLSVLVQTSRFLRDNRLMATMRELARSDSAPQRLRLAALRVLVSYFDSNSVVFQEQLEHATNGTAGGIWGETGFGATVTADSLRATAPMEIGVTLAQLAAGSSDPVVKAAARFLRRNLYYVRPADTPLLAGSLGLAYNCGNLFRIRNSGDISPRLTYVVLEFSESRLIYSAAPDSGEAFRDTYFATTNPGTVQLWFNGRLIQTAENLGTGCN
jgi:hypothetical protein